MATNMGIDMHDGYLREQLPRRGVSQQVQALVSCFKAAGNSQSSSVIETAAQLFKLRMRGEKLPVLISSEDEVDLVENALLEVAGQYPVATNATEILDIARGIQGTAVSGNVMKFSVA